ncbi:MAG TPA: von Willebrand factor type A domain-containing protein [Pseudobdellovibrionaceae bacterium]|nr:von Willebrand factor type A domain-containing protein [Pseudobdellovibrionaceae bacterium]
MAQEIEKDPELKKQVEEIREVAGDVREAIKLESQATPHLSVAEREQIFAKTLDRKSAGARWFKWVGFAFAGSMALVFVGYMAMPSFQRFQAVSRPEPAQHMADQQLAENLPAAVDSNHPVASQAEMAKRGQAQSAQPPAQLLAGSPQAPAELAADAEGEAMLEEADSSLLDQSIAAAPPPSAKVAAPMSPSAVRMGGLSRAREAKSDSFAALAPGRGVPAKMKKESRAAVDVAHNTEAYSPIVENEFKLVKDQPLSTFSVDVDTASYANVRRLLVAGQMPQPDAVRIEEMVNYFKYELPQPRDGRPFSVTTEISQSPWTPQHQLLRIALKGREMPASARPASNLVFLVDVSGSMEDPTKLPLARRALKMLVDQMRAKDKISIVVYASSTGLVLPPTSGENKTRILEALDRLQAGGSTNGEGGLRQAYQVAEENFIKGGINRVILATDGDFNVGVSSEGGMQRLIEEKAKSGVFLSVLGFGMGNYKDSMMQTLAQKGNGVAAYIDSVREARRVLVEQAGGTLNTIAKDVKLQLEFNPAQVQSYRLIGYESRMLAAEDFNDDKKDAGEIGEGHTVTAIYEIVPVGVVSPVTSPQVDALKYQAASSEATAVSGSSELLTVKLRFKKPDGDVSDKIEVPVQKSTKSFGEASRDHRFAASVAGFGMILRGSKHHGDWSLAQVLQTASATSSGDEYRQEFVELVKRAQSLRQGQR